MIAYERRACTVLYNLITCHQLAGPILLPANICPIVPITLHKAGRRFEFVDISLSTLCIDHDKLLERWRSLAEPPSGLIYARTFGAIFNVAMVFEEIKRLTPNALIIDDRCACAPSFEADVLPEYVDAVLFSTGYAKYADIGFGGYAFIRNGSLYRRTELAFVEGDLEFQTAQYKMALASRQKFDYVDNEWLDCSEPEVDWATYRKIVELKVVQTAIAKKSINDIYISRLPPEIQLDPLFQSWRFNIHVADKKSLMVAIFEAGLFASGHYDSLDGVFGFGSGENVRKSHRHIINLFNDLHFDEERAELLTDLICKTNGLAPSSLSL